MPAYISPSMEYKSLYMHHPVNSSEKWENMTSESYAGLKWNLTGIWPICLLFQLPLSETIWILHLHQVNTEVQHQYSAFWYVSTRYTNVLFCLCVPIILHVSVHGAVYSSGVCKCKMIVMLMLMMMRVMMVLVSDDGEKDGDKNLLHLTKILYL